MKENPNITTGESRRDYDHFTQRFLEREDCLILISQLNQLIKAVQRHRGISMGILAGNADFLVEFQSLQSQLERRLATLESFARASELLGERDKQNLSLAWETIRNNWEGDKLNDNFELHSHFIGQLLAMISNLSKRLRQPLVAISPTSSGSANLTDDMSARGTHQQAILAFVTGSLLDMIEQTARMRGTAVYASVAGMHGLDARKVKYWLSLLTTSTETLRRDVEFLPKSAPEAMVSMKALPENEKALHQFIQLVRAALFEKAGGRDVAHRLFNMATDIIEVYWRVVKEGLDLLHAWQRQELETWIWLEGS